ncbi:MAG: hypothetical protein HeimC3_37090 [Candidatus Heimdallarchaeota archaeon LC_3]|nr:MAG: hypothetical protein HeimC3_37090 [Candidatus Heimdallarchaeota archaeon LC_3]
MNKKPLMMIFSLVFLVSVFAVGMQSGVTATTETVYQTIEMPLSNNPLYSTNSLENSGGSSCTASSTYPSFSLNPNPPDQFELQASIGYMAFDGFINESDSTFVPFIRDPSNLSIIFPQEDGEFGQSPNMVESSGVFQDRPPNWVNVTAVYPQGTPNPLTTPVAPNYLQEFFQFEKIIDLTSQLDYPLVVAELHWMDCNAIFDSNLVIDGFFNETNQFNPIKVNDTTSKYIDFSDTDGRPALLFPTENWYDMPQLNFNVTGVWNLSDYDVLKTLDENVLDPSNMLLSWTLAPDGRSPELVELKQIISNSTDLVASVSITFKNDCSCERWYYVEENHGDSFFTTQIASEGAINFTEYDFGFYEDYGYTIGSNHPWKRWLKAVYLVSDVNQNIPPQDPQTVKNYFNWYDQFENIAYLLPRVNGTHLTSGTQIVLVVVEEFCPPAPEGCWFPYVLETFKDTAGLENQIYPVFELGQPLIRLNDYGWYMPFNHEVLGVYNYSEFDFSKDPIEDQFAYNYLDWFDGADNKIWLWNDNGIWEQTRLVIVMVDRNCPCEEGRVIAGLDGLFDTLNNKIEIHASGDVLDLNFLFNSGEDNNPSFLFEEFFPGEVPQWDLGGPREIIWLGVYVNSTYNFNILSNDQTATNYYQSFDQSTNKMQLNGIPGDSNALLLVAELVWKCGCFPGESEMGVSVFFNEMTNTEMFVYASGSVVNLPNGRPEKIHFFYGMGPGGDREPDNADILGVFVNATYNFDVDWFSQGDNLNLLQSYDETSHQIILTNAPGDNVELLIVMKLFWYCEDACVNNKAPLLVSHSADQVVYTPVDDTYVLRLKFEDDANNNHSNWKVWMGDKFLEGTWTGYSVVIEIKFSDYFDIVEGLDVTVEVDVLDDCGAKGGYNLYVKFTDNPTTTTTTDDDSSSKPITTSPGFELFAILLGLAVIGIIVRRRN